MTTRKSTWNGLQTLSVLKAAVLLMAGLLVISTLTGCGGEGKVTGSLGGQVDKILRGSAPAETKAAKLLRLIPKFKKAKDSGGAERCLNAAADEADKAFDDAKRATIFVRLAKSQFGLNKKSAAAKSLDKAEESVKKIETVAVQIDAMASIAEGYLGIDAKYGVKYAAKAEKLLDKVENVSERARLLGKIAVAYHTLGKADEATRMIDAMIAKAGEQTDAYKKATAMAAIAQIYNAVGDKDAAWKQCKAAKTDAAKIKIPGSQAIVLCNIALAAKAAGHKKDALKIVAEAKDLAEDGDQTPESQNAALAKVKKTKDQLNKKK